MEFKMTKSAYETIREESLRCETENGGLVIGPTKIPISIRSTRAGYLAKLSHVSYSNDANYDNMVLQEAIKEYKGRVKLLGYWHKHPGKMSYPSSGDLATAQGIVKRIEENGDKRPVFFIITNVVNDQVELYCYLLNGYDNFMPIKIKIISDDSKEIEKALDAEPVTILPKTMDFWNDPDFQFYLTANGYQRLQDEIDELKSNGYLVKVHAKGQLYLVIIWDNTKLLCLPPAEYPLNPPRFFMNNKEIQYSLPIWNSSFRLIGILKSLEQSLIERRIYENRGAKTSAGLSEFIGKVKKTVESIWYHKKG